MSPSDMNPRGVFTSIADSPLRHWRQALTIFGGLNLIALSVISGCSDNPSPVDPTEISVQSFVENVSPYPSPPQEFDREFAAAAESTITSSEGTEVCSVETFEMGRNPHEVIAFNPNANALWPGCIVQGVHLEDGILVPVSVGRTPLTIGVARVGSKVIDSPNAFNVTSAIDDIVNDYLEENDEMGTQLALTMTEAHSFEQGLLDIGIAVGWPGGDVRSQFNYAWQSRKNTLFLKFTQTYFTATVDPPASADAYFDDSVTVDQLRNHTANGNPLCYVSGVTYGRIGILSMTSSVSSSDMELALKLSFDDIKTNGEIEVESWHAGVISESEIKLLVIGGQSTDIVISLTDPVESLVTWIRRGQTLREVTDAKPISYTVAHLRDNSVALFQYTTRFSLRTCQWADQAMRFDVYKIKCEGEEGGTTPALEGKWYVTLTSTIPGLAAPIIKKSEGSFSDFDKDETRSITTATWDNPMSSQAGAKVELRVKIIESDNGLYGDDDNMGDKTWTWTYPGWDQVAGDDVTSPPWRLFNSLYEKDNQRIRLYFRMKLGA